MGTKYKGLGHGHVERDIGHPNEKNLTTELFFAAFLHKFQFISDFLETSTMRHLDGSKEILSDGKNEHTMPLLRKMYLVSIFSRGFLLHGSCFWVT